MNTAARDWRVTPGLVLLTVSSSGRGTRAGTRGQSGAEGQVMGAVDVLADVGCYGSLPPEPLTISKRRGEMAAFSKLSGPGQR
jgi:hypothetical protein